MSFLSRGSRFLLDKLPDDYVYLKNNAARMRNFDGVVDPRCWSCSAALRHQHLVDLMSEKSWRRVDDVVPTENVHVGLQSISRADNLKTPDEFFQVSDTSDSYCTCCIEPEPKPSSKLLIDIQPKGSNLRTTIEISLPNDDNSKLLIEENRKLRLKLQQARKQEQDYLNRLEKLRNELAEIASTKKF